ncbi:MAG: phenylalanine--tRNA ligase subunit beta [Patescibacteria group bacterium]
MKISLNWLRDFVTLPHDVDPRDLADRLSLSVVEIEGWEREADRFANMVVGKVIGMERHPNADRLQVCLVDIGSAKISNFQFPISKQIPNPKFKIPYSHTIVEIVCGGKNVREGMLVATALPGAWVRWHGEGDLVELKEAEVRGVKNFGMICSGEEIGLDDLQAAQPKVGEGPQILDLGFSFRSPSTISFGSRFSNSIRQNPQKLRGLIQEKKLTPGMPLAHVLGKDDVIFEISNVSLSNRPDLWSHYGIAREIAVVYGRKLRLLQNPKQSIHSKFQILDSKFSIRVEDKRLCPRYIGTLVENVHIVETPAWMKHRLSAIGQRPISPLVDISNYVMFEVGQPVHIFDKSKIQNPKSKMSEVVVRKAMRGERMKTLDGMTRILDEEILVIADHEKPIALAGVMGGEGSGVSAKTDSIIIECATFDPVSVRTTSARLGLKTDASQRFEKSLDPHLPPKAVARVLQLIQESSADASGFAATGTVDVHAPLPAPKSIPVSFEFIERRIGMKLPKGYTKKILQGLGFSVKETAKVWNVTPPSWRATRDVSLPEDIVEEIGRHLDYNTILDALPSFPIMPPPVSAHHNLERAMKRFLTGAGFFEVAHKPFLDPATWEKFGLEKGAHVEVVNPIDPHARYLRQSLMPGLFDDVRLNKNQSASLAFFEWGRIFIPRAGEFAVKKNAKKRLPHQPITLSLVVCDAVGQEEMLRRVKGLAAAVLQAAGYSTKLTIAEDQQHPAFQKGTVFSVATQGVPVGGGAVTSALLKADLGVTVKHNIAVLSIDIDTLAGVSQMFKKFIPLPEFPAVERDLAIVIGENVTYEEVEKTIRGAASDLLESVALFDIFRGRGIPQEHKSLAFHLSFRSPVRTLTSKEADEEMQRIIAQLQKNHAAKVRE